MHLKRWITGIIALPILIVIIGYGGSLLFSFFISIVFVLALWEYFRIQFNALNKSVFVPITVSGFITGIFIVWSAYSDLFNLIPVFLFIDLMLTAFIAVLLYKDNPKVIEIVLKQVAGVLYIPLALSFFVMIRNSPDGIFWVFYILCMVFACDTGAFYTGSYFGKHKLCPAVSPGKTIEGFLGGMASVFVVGSVFKIYLMPLSSWGYNLSFFFLISIAAPLGDLFESMLKRTANVKDSGGLLPGHGGVLDRIDALLFALPVSYIFKTYIF